MRIMKKRIFSGAVCEQVVYRVQEGVKNTRAYLPNPRFENEEERQLHRLGMSRRHHADLVNANFSPASLYSTLTFDMDDEIHDYKTAKKIRDNFVRILRYKYPEAVIFIYMGRGKTTHRIHFHMLSDGIPAEYIERKWKYGSIKRIDNLRSHCFYEGVDHGQDYTGLANYLFNHWEPEQGSHRWKMTKNAKQPEVERPTEVHARGGYTAQRPPRAPKGYMLVETKETKYGLAYFKYVMIPEKEQKRKRGGIPPS